VTQSTGDEMAETDKILSTHTEIEPLRQQQQQKPFDRF